MYCLNDSMGPVYLGLRPSSWSVLQAHEEGFFFGTLSYFWFYPGKWYPSSSWTDSDALLDLVRQERIRFCDSARLQNSQVISGMFSNIIRSTRSVFLLVGLRGDLPHFFPCLLLYNFLYKALNVLFLLVILTPGDWTWLPVNVQWPPWPYTPWSYL